MEIWKLQALLLVILLVILLVLLGNANKLGGKEAGQYITSNKFAILNGTITTPDSNDSSLNGITNLSYPAGFNRTNCVVISIMGGKKGDDLTLTTPMAVSVTGALLGASELAVTLHDDKITVRNTKMMTSQSSTTTSFKLVLMKVS